jgi:hypothetical protein
LAPVHAAPDLLVRVNAVLFWRVKDDVRTVSPSGGGLDRFLPYRPLAITAEGICP